MTLGLKDRFSIVKGLLYLTLGICCIYLIVTGRYLNYIAPRYELLLGISGVALILGGLALFFVLLFAYQRTFAFLALIVSFILYGFVAFGLSEDRT